MSTPQVLDEFADVMPPELPRALLLKRAKDHRNDLETGTRPPAHAFYQILPSILVELRKQLDELLDAGFI